jgi:broad specificity phosphatase PhoE
VDTQLTDLGISQARDLGQWMRKQEISIDAIYASTLSRAYNTAQLIAESYDAMEVIGDDRLRERDA